MSTEIGGRSLFFCQQKNTQHVKIYIYIHRGVSSQLQKYFQVFCRVSVATIRKGWEHFIFLVFGGKTNGIWEDPTTKSRGKMLTTWSEVKFTAMLVLGGAKQQQQQEKKHVISGRKLEVDLQVWRVSVPWMCFLFSGKKVVEIIKTPRTSEQITIVPKPELYKGIFGAGFPYNPHHLGWPTDRLVAIICPDDFLTSGRNLRNVFGDDFYGENGQFSYGNSARDPYHGFL